MNSGSKPSSAPRASSASLSEASRPPLRMYHWRVVMISSGLSPFSKNLTGWRTGVGLLGHRAGFAEQLDDPHLGGVRGLARQFGVRGATCLALDPGRRIGEDSPVPTQHRAHGERELAPPGHVGRVTERADHRDAGALVGRGEVVRDDGHLDTEQRRADGRAEEGLVPGVVGVGDECDARGEEFGPGGLDEHVTGAVARHRPARTPAR